MVQEITTTSWGSRILGSFFGVLFGIALIIGSFVAVFWNEGSSLHTSQSLQQTQQVLITVPASPIDEKNNMKVIYFTGEAVTDDELSDSLLKYKVNAIKLIRHVTMYQWQEDSKTETDKQYGGSEKNVTTYTYKTVWSDDPIDSTQFKEQTGHINPATMPFKSHESQATNVTVGDFKLPQELIYNISGKSTVESSKIDLSNLQSKTKLKVQPTDEEIYVGNDPQYPVVGDMKITLVEVLPQTVSVIAQQTGDILQGYKAPAGKTIALLTSEEKSPDAMIQDALSENSLMAWIIRLATLIGLMVGVYLILKPLTVMLDVIPFLGSLASFGMGLIAFVIGLLLWGVATAIAWFVVRPLIAIILLVIIIGICYLIIKKRHKTIQQQSG